MVTINELFAGIGTQALAFKYSDIPYKVVGISEIDKNVIQAYSLIHGETRNYGDISKVEALDYADMWTYSFPCQDLTCMGKKKGMTEGDNTRSSLLWQVKRLLIKSKEDSSMPKYLMLENVKEVVERKNIDNFNLFKESIEELGYNNYYKTLNAKNFGIPQSRNRVFMISIRKDIDNGDFEFPDYVNTEVRLVDILEEDVSSKYNLREDFVCTVVQCNVQESLLTNRIIKIASVEGYKYNMLKLVYSVDGIMQTLACRQPLGWIYYQGRYRSLTPLECYRSMGIKDEDFNKIKDYFCDSNLYKFAGNAIVVNIMSEIFKALF